jgi:hypothetical protein
MKWKRKIVIGLEPLEHEARNSLDHGTL